MIFAKAHALGNDFILIKTNKNLTKQFILSICNRKTGIGCDQLLAIDKNNNIKIWNQDGSIAKMCGNGLRAFAKWLNEDHIIFHTVSGDVIAEKLGENIKLTLNPAIIQKKSDVFIVNTGNEHKIYIKSEPVSDLSKYAEKEYNVSCIYKKDDIYHAKTWERGAGETGACGSAAYAIASVLDMLGEKFLDVEFKLGKIQHMKEDNVIKQIGCASVVAVGSIEPHML